MSSSEIPEGLECLTYLDHLFVKPQKQILNIFTNFDGRKKYRVLDSNGQVLYYAAEFSGYWMTVCCGASRGFNMSIINSDGKEIIHFERPFRCDSCFCACCLQGLTVCAPPGHIIGKVKQVCHPLIPKFAVFDHTDKIVLYIKGPPCEQCVCVKFDLYSSDNVTPVGRITRKWSGLSTNLVAEGQEILGMNLPANLDVRCKATMLCSAVFLDLMYLDSRFH